MTFDNYIKEIFKNKKISRVKLDILKRLWHEEKHTFPKPWVSSADLLKLTNQKYFDRRARELRDHLGCDIETKYLEEVRGHAWRIKSRDIAPPMDRDYLTKAQKNKLFTENDFHCVICGIRVEAGIRGLQADHRIPLSRGGGNDLSNWQPICNNCNVGKRRACEGCVLDCKTCSWAFPDTVGVKLIMGINEETIRRLDVYSEKMGQSRDKVMEDAAEYFLNEREKGV